MSFAKDRTKVKNQIHSTLAKYGLKPEEELDIFTREGRAWLEAALQRLPPETRRCMEQRIETLDHLEKQIAIMEKRIRDQIRVTPEMELLKSLPGVGDILAVVIALEMGSVERFAKAENLVGYSGTAPKARNSGGAIRYGGSRNECNHYLKWAFHEAANAVSRQRNHPLWRHKHVVFLYERVRKHKGHGIAIGAVARHLAEAAYWVLKKGEPYVDPNIRKGLSKQRQARGEAGSERTED
jgi:transposase